ncbi:MAG: CBS domain-containing protein, partial [Mariprofundus sp.]|nr:CBS domain-containing protein [Mariprofundus sp.]
MLAERIMITNIVTANAHESVESVLERMREAKLRMIPITDENNTVIGV